MKSLEVRLEGREAGVLDAFARFVQRSSGALGSPCPPPSTPPVRFDRWTVLSSPHVHKTARTQFERRTHARLLTVYNLDDALAPRLLWYLRQHAPPDVRVDAVHHRYVELSRVV
jgi:small subunit ribosomal protein S10